MSEGKDRRRWILKSSILTTLVVGVLMVLGITGPMETATLDARFALQNLVQEPGEGDKPQVAVVAIDTTSLAELGTWPWPRSYHAELVDRLSEAGAKAIGFDVIFSEPSPRRGDDMALAASLQGDIPVILPVVVEATEKRNLFFPGEFGSDSAQVRVGQVTFPLPEFRGSSRLGHIAVIPDRDGIVRRIRTVLARFPSLSFQLAAVADNKVSLESIPESFLVNWNQPIVTLSYKDVFAGDFPEDVVKDKIVLIGSVAPGLKADFFPTSLRFFGYLPGVIIQAKAVQTILNREFIQQFPATPLGALGLSFVTSLIGFTLFFGRSPLKKTLILLTLIAGVVVISLLLFAQNIWLLVIAPLIFPLGISFTFSVIVGQLTAEKARNAIREIFGRYLPQSVLRHLMQSPDSIALGGVEKKVAVLFADIRGFTSYTESQEPGNVVRELNQAYEKLVPLIERNGGIVDKFLGDALMAVFGAPQEVENPEEKAVQAGMEIMATSDFQFSLGIGVASGTVVAGNIGTKDQLSYTVIGTPVNIAARLEELAEGGEILVSREVWFQLPLSVQQAFEPLGAKELRGLSHPVEVYSYQKVRECRREPS